MSIGNKIAAVRRTLPAGVELVAVSKYHPAEAIREAYDAGQRVFGENRPQEMKAKHEILPHDIEWRMIGHLQTNKVKYIAPFVSMIESLDSERLAAAVDKEAAKYGRTIDCLLEIHVADEDTKSGWNYDELDAFVRGGGFDAYRNIRIPRRVQTLAGRLFRTRVRHVVDGHVRRLPHRRRVRFHRSTDRLRNLRGAGVLMLFADSGGRARA